MSLATESDHSQMKSETEDCLPGIADGNDDAWENALKDEDCVGVKKLLDEKKLLEQKKELLTKGWKEDNCPEAESMSARIGNLVEGFEEPVPKSKPHRVWKGRTALHIAVRRGDTELVMLIRKILHPEGGKCSTQCHLLEVIDRDYELDALAMAVVNGNQGIVTLLKLASRDCGFNPHQIGLIPGQDSEKTGAISEENMKQSEDRSKEVCPEKSVRGDDGLAPGEDSEKKSATFEERMKQKLKDITKNVLPKAIEEHSFVKEELYGKDCDYNFLDISLYLFHFAFSTWKSKYSEKIVDRFRNKIFDEAIQDEGLLRYLLNLQDGQGRTPLHVAVDSNKVQKFFDLIPSSSLDRRGSYGEFLNAKDGAGRTPLYRAAAKNQLNSVEILLEDDRVNLNEKVSFQLGPGLDLDKLSWRNRFKSGSVYIPKEKLWWKSFNNNSNSQGGPGPNIQPLESVSSTALHVAIILKHEKIVRCMVQKLGDKSKGEGTEWCCRHFTSPVGAWKGDHDTSKNYVSTMKLAVLVGSIPILQLLLETEQQKPGLFTGTSNEKDLPSFHLAAAIGNPVIIKAFLDSEGGYFDPRKLDVFNNTALHHALKGKDIKFQPHLVDFVGCHHVFHWRWENDDYISEWLDNPESKTKFLRAVEKFDAGKIKDRHGKRLGSINLLLEAGIDIWAKNLSKRIASPEPDAPDDFVKWWYEKVAAQMQQLQATLNAAANAISVTAALVATASYVGPLQPPLGYDGNSVQVNISAVRVFVVSDSLSFYLALAAIMLALLPSLPLPKESMFKEMVRTRILVAAAVSFLFPSIACVLVAFAAGSIAVLPDHGLAYHGLTVGTAAAGGFLCLVVMIVALDRWLNVYNDVSDEIAKLRRRLISSVRELLSNIKLRICCCCCSAENNTRTSRTKRDQG